MNYLGHAYLSFGEPEIIVGNMISDFVKGKTRFGYTVNIQKGIMLHRDIDQYTDTHPVIKKAKELFRSDYRLYSGAVVDVILDHFLAKDDAAFGKEGLMTFTKQVYDTLDGYKEHLPTRFQAIFPYMKRDNWLYHYSSLDGISRSLNGLVQRAVYLEDYKPAVTILKAHYRFLESCYKDFIPDVKDFAKSQLERRSL